MCHEKHILHEGMITADPASHEVYSNLQKIDINFLLVYLFWGCWKPSLRKGVSWHGDIPKWMVYSLK